MNGPSESAFNGQSAFDDARARVEQRAADLQALRRDGSIAAFDAAAAAALADTGVRQVGSAERRVYVSFGEHGEFRGLRVTTADKTTVFAHQR